MNTEPSSPSVYRWLIMGLTFLTAFILSGWLFLSLPVFLPYMGEDLGLNEAAVQFIFGIVALVRIGSSLMGGFLGDRYSLKWVVGIGGATVGVSALLRGVIPGYGGALTASVILGGGLGVVLPSLIGITAHWFPSDELAMANGVRLVGSLSGAAVGQGFVAGWLLDWLGHWRAAQSVLGVTALAAASLWLVVYRQPDDEGDPDESPEPGGIPAVSDHSLYEAARRVFDVRDMVIMAVAFIVGAVGTQGNLGLLPTWLGRVEMIGREAAGFYSSLWFWALVPGALFWPVVSDRIGYRKPIIYTMFLVALTGRGVFILGILVGSLPLLVGGLLGGAFGAGGILPLLFSIPGEHPEVGPEWTATAIGFLVALSQLGGSVGPPLGGAVLDYAGILPSMIVLLVPSALSGGLYILVSETGPAAQATV